MIQPSSAPIRSTRSTRRKTIVQMVVGALVGGTVTFGVLTAVGRSGFDLDDPARVLALATGIVFALIGLVAVVDVALNSSQLW